MSNIIVNAAPFQCEAPVVGNVYRNGSTYIFNWTSKGDLYQSYGLPTTIKLFYFPETSPPEIEYTGQQIPFNADNFTINYYFNYDMTSFRLELRVDTGDEEGCYHSIEIPYSQIQIIN